MGLPVWRAKMRLDAFKGACPAMLTDSTAPVIVPSATVWSRMRWSAAASTGSNTCDAAAVGDSVAVLVNGVAGAVVALSATVGAAVCSAVAGTSVGTTALVGGIVVGTTVLNRA